jgi:hypothetical protein
MTCALAGEVPGLTIERLVFRSVRIGRNMQLLVLQRIVTYMI